MIRLAGVMFACVLFTLSAQAENKHVPLSFKAMDNVVYCSVGPVSISERLKLALREGTPVTFYWKLIVDRQRSYWMNDNLATIEFSRTVMPDLVTRSWVLSDSSSGISKRVMSLERAIDFLTGLRYFPMLDQSLLDAQEQYVVRVRLYSSEGEVDDRWWQEALRFTKTQAVGRLTFE